MPQLDQTGPQGMGPGTGRGAEKCGYNYGHGRGVGFCRRFYNPSRTEEKEMLLQEIEDVKDYVASMEARIKEIEKEEK